MDLANYLKSGSLPAGVVYTHTNSIGPSLGDDSIHAGLVAGAAGLVAVIFVMLVYYRRSGVNAVLALFLNTVLLLAALSYFHAVLTLPGIAGVILTVGMAVDSNVLIFERIREELRAGKAVIAAVDNGFQQSVVDHCGHARHNGGIVRLSVPVRRGAGARVRGNLGDRSDRQRLHGGIHLQDDFRVRVVRPPGDAGTEYLMLSAAIGEREI